MLSFWEKDAWFGNIDVCVIGSGIVGLSTALHLKKTAPDLKILILERGLLPTGASTKNAGFACFGSLSEILSDLNKMPEVEVIDLIAERFLGLQLLRETLGDHAIDYKEWGGFEMFTAEQESLFERCMELMPRLNILLKERFKISSPIFINADEKNKIFGFSSLQHLIKNTLEGQIDTGKMMQALIHKVQQEGITILTGTALTDWTETATGVELNTQPFGNIKTGKLVFATNGFASQLLPELDVKPGRAQALITCEIENLKIKGCFHFDEGYYYFRNIGKRLLLGGGRNLDFKGEETYAHHTTDKIQNALETFLSTVILPNQSYTIEQRWSGTLGLGEIKKPIIQTIGKHSICAVRMGGMGVAIGSLVGKKAAALLLT
jgi:glycine/D-amino acid oxidase-like deaminating enzyme